MELKIYDIIKRPFVTTKSVELYKKLNQYTFEVHKEATKGMICDAVEKLWNVKVDKVRVVTIKGKNKVFNRRAFQTPSRKKAIVALKKGFKIEIPGMFETMANESIKTSSDEAEGS